MNFNVGGFSFELKKRLEIFHFLFFFRILNVLVKWMILRLWTRVKWEEKKYLKFLWELYDFCRDYCLRHFDVLVEFLDTIQGINVLRKSHFYKIRNLFRNYCLGHIVFVVLHTAFLKYNFFVPKIFFYRLWILKRFFLKTFK